MEMSGLIGFDISVSRIAPEKRSCASPGAFRPGAHALDMESRPEILLAERGIAVSLKK